MATDVVSMANQIAANIAIGGTVDEGALKTADHINRFWTSAMIGELRLQAANGAQLNDAAAAALAQLRAPVSD